MKQKIFTAVFFLGLMLSLTGCLLSGKVPERYYYTLQDDLQKLDKTLINKKPYDVEVWVTETRIPPVYRRIQIVERHAGPRISYRDNHLWANTLETRIQELIANRIESYETFTTLTSTDSYRRPDLELSSEITRLEYSTSSEIHQAIFGIRLELKQLQGTDLITTKFSGAIDLEENSLEAFVETVNRKILETADQFVKDLHNYSSEGGELTNEAKE